MIQKCCILCVWGKPEPCSVKNNFALLKCSSPRYCCLLKKNADLKVRFDSVLKFSAQNLKIISNVAGECTSQYTKIKYILLLLKKSRLKGPG